MHLSTLFFRSTGDAAISLSPSITSRGGTVALWATQIAMARMFLFAGGLKLTGADIEVQLFDAIGIGQWFRYLTGSIEVTGALLLVSPQLALYGALLLIPTMLGAIASHWFVIGGSPVPAIVLLVGSSAIAWLRPHQLAGALARTR